MLQDTLSTEQLLNRCHNALVMLSDAGSHTRSQGNEHSTAVTKCNRLSAHATLIPWYYEHKTRIQHTLFAVAAQGICETDTAQWKANRAPLAGDQLSVWGRGEPRKLSRHSD
jgi:hypothetical protein